jgi:hypothetical protein
MAPVAELSVLLRLARTQLQRCGPVVRRMRA